MASIPENTMRTIKQLSLFVENTPGSISKVCRVLKDNDLSISTLSLADTSEFGILRLLIKESDAAAKALTAAGFVVKSADVLALTVPISAMDDRGRLTLRFIFPEAQKPGGGDERELSVAFASLQLASIE